MAQKLVFNKHPVCGCYYYYNHHHYLAIWASGPLRLPTALKHGSRGRTGVRGLTQGSRTFRLPPRSCDQQQNPFATPTPAGPQGPCERRGRPAWASVQPQCRWVTARILWCLLFLLEEAAAGVNGIDVYFDNEFSMRLQTNKINSLGCIFNSQLYCGRLPWWLMGNAGPLLRWGECLRYLNSQ